MSCKKLTYQNFDFLEVVHRKNATAFKKNRRNGDHLGNVRLTYADSNGDGSITPATEIISEKNYYPFGLQHKGYNNVVSGTENNYQTFQGQEEEKELGKNTYAYQWRDYDPAIARFNKVDRFSEKYFSHSPYAFTKNNPIRYREIAGDSLWISFGKDNANRVLYQDGNLLNADGSRYEGEGVKVKKDGSIRIKNSFLKSAVRELGKVSEAEAANGTNVISTLQGSDNNFTIAQGSNHFDPGTFDQPYLFANNATYNMTTQTGLKLTPFWNPETMGYAQQAATQAGSGGIIYFDGQSSNGVKLGHEAFHAFDADSGSLIHTPIVDPRTHIGGTVIGEIRASTFGNQIRSHHSVKPLRGSYNEGGFNLLNTDGSMKQMPPSILINKN